MEDTRNPTWSPDENCLAYPVKCDQGCLAVRTVATGEVRRLAPMLIDARAPNWSPDGTKLIARGVDTNGQSGLFQIDVVSGEAKVLVPGDEPRLNASWSRDGKKIYLSNRSHYDWKVRL
jgi:Tol biopolymer transport system component